VSVYCVLHTSIFFPLQTTTRRRPAGSMQNFDFGTLRGGQDRDHRDSYDDYGSRAVSSVYPGYNGKATSSVYSGPGPAEESAHHSLYGQNVQRQPIEEEQPQRRNVVCLRNPIEVV